MPLLHYCFVPEISKGIQMANTIHVDVVRRQESVFSGEARFVACPVRRASWASIHPLR